MTVDISIHRRTWDQIPWIVNGTLATPELEAAAQHLQSCNDCREELEFQRHIAQSLGSNDMADVDPQRSWQQLLARIEAPMESSMATGAVAGAAAPAHVVAVAHPRWTGWLVAAMVVQAIGLGVLGTSLWSRQSSSPAASPAVYRTLSASAPGASATPTIRVVFAADMSIGRLQALLSQAGLQVASGPSSAGVWSLGPAGESTQSATQAALQQLRGNPDVSFAEAVEGFR